MDAVVNFGTREKPKYEQWHGAISFLLVNPLNKGWELKPGEEILGHNYETPPKMVTKEKFFEIMKGRGVPNEQLLLVARNTINE